MSKGTYQRENLFDVAIVQHTITGTNLAGVVASADDLYLIEQLRSGNEAAFVALIDRYANTMLRLARVYVTAWAVAEEVVQETWLAVLEGLSRFEGRSSLKTWMFRILTNSAITRVQREGRSIPFASLSDIDTDQPDRILDTNLRELVLLTGANREVQQALSSERLERAIGVIYLPETERVSHYFEARLAQQFDAIIHVDETRAVEPLERTSQWEAGELPETYPSAV